MTKALSLLAPPNSAVGAIPIATDIGMAQNSQILYINTYVYARKCIHTCVVLTCVPTYIYIYADPPIDLPFCVLDRPETAADVRFLMDNKAFEPEQELIYLSMRSKRASLFFNRLQI